jgi:hypothetical protein
LDVAHDLEIRTWQSNLKFWRRRDRRCLASNRYYQRVRSPVAVGHATRDLDPDLVAALLADPDGPFCRSGERVFKDSASSTVIELDGTTHRHPAPLIYKRFRVTTWTDPWTALVRRSPALRSWLFGQGLRERLLPTARPLMVLHRRRFGLCREGYLLTEKILDAIDLHQAAKRLTAYSSHEHRLALRRLIEQAGQLVRDLHRRNLAHRDLKAANVLVQDPLGDCKLWFIDLAGVSRHRKLSLARRVQNLARLHASFHRNPALTRTDKLRFLRVYLQWGLLGRGGWKRWWRKIDRATQAKVQRNLRSGRPLA